MQMIIFADQRGVKMSGDALKLRYTLALGTV